MWEENMKTSTVNVTNHRSKGTTSQYVILIVADTFGKTIII